MCLLRFLMVLRRWVELLVCGYFGPRFHWLHEPPEPLASKPWDLCPPRWPPANTSLGSNGNHTICLVGTIRLGKPVVLLFTLYMWRCRGFVSFEKTYSPQIQCCQKAVFWILINTTQKQTEGKAMALSSTGSTESLGETYSVVRDGDEGVAGRNGRE